MIERQETGGAMSDVTVTLTSEEALVLFEWLVRSSDRGAPAPFVDQAEERVLWVVEGALERSLVAPLQPDYAAQLQQARDRVRGD
jgi:hypothetical protein